MQSEKIIWEGEVHNGCCKRGTSGDARSTVGKNRARFQIREEYLRRKESEVQATQIELETRER